MAELRERPYSQFNFLVDLGTGDTESPQAGFQEVSGLGMEITIAEYRNGNEKDNAARKITGTYKVPDVTLKRGVIGALDLYEWLDQVRSGSQNALRTITIQLLSEDRTTTAMVWKLTNARPMKYTGPALNGKGTDVAVEELVLACERIELA
ncbi:MAG: phage tail protein [Chloroflexi bacterium]|nr:phage tail protein [Chloroflexota bacterium]MCI0576987.1 phage tail protein [Chloroflexota bacterium]MCI0647792.1 phage tail protein [Chloroflexota bacterium]MCI0729006.1 phage tail protein [Chloroflexota bacterium]